jgi:multimeric flavodoxin WrbA
LNVLTTLGSPRRRGNTAAVLERFEERIRTYHFAERIELPRKSIHGCLGCEACQGTLDTPSCVQRDPISEAGPDVVPHCSRPSELGEPA